MNAPPELVPAVGYLVRTLAARPPCRVRVSQLGLEIAFFDDGAPLVEESGAFAASVPVRAVGMASVADGMDVAQSAYEVDAVTKLFDVDGWLAVTDVRTVVVGGLGWSSQGVVDLGGGTFLAAVYEHVAIAGVTRGRTTRRQEMTITTPEPLAALTVVPRGRAARGALGRMVETIVRGGATNLSVDFKPSAGNDQQPAPVEPPPEPPPTERSEWWKESAAAACSNCGRTLETNARFCGACGAGAGS